MEYPINVVVDIGGTGAKLALSTRSGLKNICREHPKSPQDFFACIRKLTGGLGPDALAVAVPGIMLGKEVVHAHNAPWLGGNPAETIGRELLLNDKKIHLINDGEAHALALKTRPDTKLGAIHLSIGTGVGFGVLNENGEVLRTLSGNNWEIGDVRLVTQAPDKEAWRLLGSAGFEEQIKRTDTDGGKYFGWRLGNLASQLITMPFCERPQSA
jgi:predicted NBD/HSP70 family sugar kinase